MAHPEGRPQAHWSVVRIEQRLVGLLPHSMRRQILADIYTCCVVICHPV
jgi:hypothetical protein